MVWLIPNGFRSREDGYGVDHAPTVCPADELLADARYAGRSTYLAECGGRHRRRPSADVKVRETERDLS